MQLSIAKDIFGSPWHLDASGIQQYFPIVLGMMNGASIVVEQEPHENIPFAISANTNNPVAWSGEDSEEEEEETQEKVVHVLPVRGVMMKHDMACGPRGTRTLGNRLLKADADSSVIGHVMIFEGPGGASNAVPELADAMKKCTKPIMGFVDGYAYSAHQYALSYSTETMASRETDGLGSIGTMIVYRGRKSISDENLFNEREVTIYADEAFEKNEEYEKAINDFDFKLSKERILNPHNKQFQEDIKANCPGVKDEHLHGKTFQAKDVIGSLIGSIGTFDDAVNRVVELSKYKKTNNAQNSAKPGQTAQNQSNKTTQMKQFKNVNTALGVESLEAVDESVSLNETELEALDSALGVDASAEVQTQLDSANETIGERDTTITGLEEQVETANTTISERDETITSLNAEIESLKGDPAAPPATVITKKDGSGSKQEGKPISDGHAEPLDALEEISQEYLGKSVND